MREAGGDMDSDEAAQAAKDGPALASEALVVLVAVLVLAVLGLKVAVLVHVATLVAVPAGARAVATALGLELGLVVPVPALVPAAVLALAFAVARLWAGRARALGLALAAVGPGTGPRSLSGPWNHLRALCILPSYRHQTERTVDRDPSEQGTERGSMYCRAWRLSQGDRAQQTRPEAARN